MKCFRSMTSCRIYRSDSTNSKHSNYSYNGCTEGGRCGEKGGE
ncbi:MAG: hypothetical protein ABIK92_16735 [Pseudomonadota bacterium]